MPRYEVTSDRIAGVKRGDVVDLDPDAVNIPALLAAGHVKPAPKRRSSDGDVRTR